MTDQITTLSEGKTLEFKRDLSSPRPILKTLVAFSNTAGGRLLIGVDDDRRVVGVSQPLDEEERVCSLIADSILPRLVPNEELMTLEDKTVLVVEVFLSGLRPHYLKAEGPENGVYVRLGSTNRQADRELIGDLRRSAEGVAFDELPMPDLSQDDLDVAAIRDQFRDRHHLDEEELFSLKLLTREQGRSVPTKGAVLLFGKDRIRHFPDAWIQCGRFVGRDKADIFDHMEIHDNLPQAVENIILFLKKHALRGADFSEIRRKDVWNIPLGILREVVINALVHADYSQRGAPTCIAFYDDRIEVENPGILLPGMTIDDMKQGISRIRNHVIARVFRELNLIEQWGSGVRRIIKEAEALGLPELQIKEIGMRMRITVTLAEPILTSAAKDGGAESQPEIDAGAESKAESGAESDMEMRILVLLEKEPLSKSEIAKRLGKGKPSGYLNSLIRNLIQAGKLDYTIPEKPNSRLQKYRIKKFEI